MGSAADQNDTEYSLAASVWSADMAKVEAIDERIEAGSVWVNEIHSFSSYVAFGGAKQPGLSVENAPEGLAEYPNVQTIVTRQTCVARLSRMLLHPRRCGLWRQGSVAFGTTQFSFRELDTATGRLAPALVESDLRPDDVASQFRQPVRSCRHRAVSRISRLPHRLWHHPDCASRNRCRAARLNRTLACGDPILPPPLE